MDASVSYRKWKESESGDYLSRIINIREDSKKEAEKDGVVVPTTIHEYCKTGTPGRLSAPCTESIENDEDWYDDEEEFDEYEEGSEDEESEDDKQKGDNDEEEDSGNGD